MIDQPTMPIVSPLIGLALYKAASATWPYLDWSLKAPNDLFVGGKKIAGILLETISQGDDHRLLIGLGFNAIKSPLELSTAVSLAKALPDDTPLLAQDWISFLERLVFEFSFSLQQSFEPLNPSTRQALLFALNKNSQLTEKYISIDESANMKTDSKTISWQEL
jgi:BirA family biotin operon repressor/biotin-[acetyl-CoA-carboxylase] ligase